MAHVFSNNNDTQRTFTILITNFVRSLKAQRRSEGTLDYYWSKFQKLVIAFPDMGWEDLTTSDIREFLIALKTTTNLRSLFR